MWRALAFWIAAAAVLAFQFSVYPGHSYLTGDSQLFVPMLEHLDHPGLLSRDLLAQHPNVTYTIYDEATLFFEHVGHVTLRESLLGQLLLFRAASLMGFYLLARSLALHRWHALAVAGLVECGAYLPGIDIHLIDREPVPSAFAFGAILLTAGLFARRRPVAAGMAAGVALLYDLTLAVPFLLLLAVFAIVDKSWRRWLRGSLPLLFASALLLANLAQLQPGIAESPGLVERTSPAIAAIQRFAVPQLWISLWSPWAMLWYLETAVFFVLIFRRLRARMQQPGLALFVGMPTASAAGLIFSFALTPWLQPTRTLLFFIAIASALFWSAWVAKWRNTALLVLASTLPFTELASRFPLKHEPTTIAMAEWAKANTWGGAVFLFPDAAKAGYPGVFRAESERAVWVDWTSRKQSAYFDSFADEWYRRWQDTMSTGYSPARMESWLLLPIDYYVLRHPNQITGVRAAYSDREFVVYDADDLRAYLKRSN